MIKPEILAPAGNLEKLQMAVRFGADAVYLGGKIFGLRAGAGNFSLEEMAEGVQFAHQHGAKVYVTVNIFAHNEDLAQLPDYLNELQSIRVNAVIVSDPGVFRLVKSTVPDMPVHISTQANTTNWSAVKFWEEFGAERIVLARELSLKEIKEIRANTNLYLEIFVHGAMCISYSGRCLLSNYLANRDANKGECAHPCRWSYSLVEEKRPGQYLPVVEDERGTYVFNSKDLCLIEYIPELIKAGVSSFKIEGRMKSAYYVATVVKAYREAVDTYWADPDNFSFNDRWLEELIKVSHRDYTTGFLFSKPDRESHKYHTSKYIRNYDFVGLVLEYKPETGEAVVEQRNRFTIGETVEFVPPQGNYFTHTINSIKNEAGELVESAPHPQQIVTIQVPVPVAPYTMIRRREVE